MPGRCCRASCRTPTRRSRPGARRCSSRQSPAGAICCCRRPPRGSTRPTGRRPCRRRRRSSRICGRTGWPRWSPGRGRACWSSVRGRTRWSVVSARRHRGRGGCCVRAWPRRAPSPRRSEPRVRAFRNTWRPGRCYGVHAPDPPSRRSAHHRPLPAPGRQGWHPATTPCAVDYDVPVAFTTGAGRRTPAAVHTAADEGEGSFVTDIDTAAPGTAEAPARRGALSAMRLPQLQALAVEMGVTGTGKMRKSELLDAIRARQGSGSRESAPQATVAAEAPPQPRTEQPAPESPRSESPRDEQPSSAGASNSRRDENQRDRTQTSDGQRNDGRNDGQHNDGRNDGQRNDGRNNSDSRRQRNNGPDDDEDGSGGGGRRRRNRYRDRKRRGNRGSDPMGPMVDEPEVSDDDVLIPVAGILDILDNYAFVRTSGYLS